MAYAPPLITIGRIDRLFGLQWKTAPVEALRHHPLAPAPFRNHC
jgi:hypothetical protein